MANLYANICHVGAGADIERVLQHDHDALGEAHGGCDYGLAVGKPADLVVLDAESPEPAVAELVPELYGFKRGRTFTARPPCCIGRAFDVIPAPRVPDRALADRPGPMHSSANTRLAAGRSGARPAPKSKL